LRSTEGHFSARYGAGEKGNAVNSKNVLIISGKGQKLTGDIRHFLRSIGLRPIEPQGSFPGGVSDLHEALQAAIYDSCAIVIVLAGEDEAMLQRRWYIPDDDMEEVLKSSPQPRLNVLFGAGVALATRPDQTILVKRGCVRLCRYFEGHRSVELGDDRKQRYAFIEKLSSVGCAVDLSSYMWIDVGDFSDPDSKK
jgi:Predicted nucleotide-binding protein containing TIR-like domain